MNKISPNPQSRAAPAYLVAAGMSVLKRKKEPAYKQLTEEQLEHAIALAESIITQSDEYIHQLNHNSLHWCKRA